MFQIISKEAIDKSDLNVENAKAYGAATGVLMGGFITAHVATKLIKKQDNILVNGGVAVASLALAMKLKNPFAKIAFIGVCAYSSLRCLNIGIAEVAAPGDTGMQGLSGFIPETIKAKLREYIPTLGGADDIQNLLGLGNTDDDSYNLDDVSDMGATEDVDYEDVSNQQELGSLMM